MGAGTDCGNRAGINDLFIELVRAQGAVAAILV